MFRLGLISDTHGLLRPQALAVLGGCDRIVHGGDIGDASILGALGRLAPVVAVRGNNDRAPWADALREVEIVPVGALRLLAIHDLSRLDADPAALGVRIVVSGHSHRPAALERGGVLHVNPGSAGPRRFSLPVSAAVIEIDGDRLAVQFFDLLADNGRAAGAPLRSGPS